MIDAGHTSLGSGALSQDSDCRSPFIASLFCFAIMLTRCLAALTWRRTRWRPGTQIDCGRLVADQDHGRIALALACRRPHCPIVSLRLRYWQYAACYVSKSVCYPVLLSDYLQDEDRRMRSAKESGLKQDHRLCESLSGAKEHGSNLEISGTTRVHLGSACSVRYQLRESHVGTDCHGHET